MANNALAMQDQEMMRDALSSEKQMTGLYNAFANECATTAIRDEMLNLLHDEHAIQADLIMACLLYTSPSPRDRNRTRMTSSA